MFDSSKLLALGITNASIVLHSLKRNFFLESFYLFLNQIRETCTTHLYFYSETGRTVRP